jgi:hypothetical protein
MALCGSCFWFVSLGIFGMFRWVYMFRSLCFSKMQATRPRCNQFFTVLRMHVLASFVRTRAKTTTKDYYQEQGAKTVEAKIEKKQNRSHVQLYSVPPHFN